MAFVSRRAFGIGEFSGTADGPAELPLWKRCSKENEDGEQDNYD